MKNHIDAVQRLLPVIGIAGVAFDEARFGRNPVRAAKGMRLGFQAVQNGDVIAAFQQRIHQM